MYDTVEIGSSPYEEDCAQVGTDDYEDRAKKECRAFINQIIRTLGSPPEGCRLFIKSNIHDFGIYYEVAAKFDVNVYEAMSYAYNVEGSCPAKWDDEARKELGI